MHNIYMSDKCHNIWQINATDQRISKGSWWGGEATSRPSAFYQMCTSSFIYWNTLSSSILMADSPWFNQIAWAQWGPTHGKPRPPPICSLFPFPCRSNIWYKLLVCMFNVCLPQLESKFQEGRPLYFLFKDVFQRLDQCLRRRNA